MKYLFAIFAILSGICLRAGDKIDLGLTDPYFVVNNNLTAGLTLEFGISEITTESITKVEGNFTRLSIPGFTSTKQLGEPEMPLFRKTFTAPVGAEISINNLDYSETELTLSKFGIRDPIYPAQPYVSKSQDPADVGFIYVEAAYRQERYSEKPLITLEEIGSVRGHRLVVLNIEPVRYDPVKGKILVINEITAEISFSTSNFADNYSREKVFSRYFNSILKSTVINYPLYEFRDTLTRYPVRYVIVADPMFEEQLQPFIDWKIQKGFDVIEAYVGDPDVGTTNLSIKAFLQELYDNASPESPAPSFLLIVGDIDQVPAWNGDTGGHVTDLNYVKLDGDDYIPEMYFGRFSANDTDQLQPQIDKTLEYEKYLMPDPSYLENVVMIAGVDSEYGPTHGNGQVYYGTNYYFNEDHDINSFTYFYPESGTSDSQIIQNVSDGVSYINYTAHGSDQGWANPTFTNSDVWSLQNYNQYCLAVGNCCLTNKFDVETCFGEAWLRAEDKGAIGYIGGTNSTYWHGDFWWSVGAGEINSEPTYESTGRGVYDGLFHDNGEPFSDWHTTTGAMIFCGNMAAVEGAGEAANYYWEIYALMGDPSLEAYLGVPEENIVSYPDAIFLGQTSIEISAEPYSYSALSMNGEIIGTVLIDETGTSVLELCNITELGTANLVVTKQNMQPFIADIATIPDGPYVVIDSYQINDGDNQIAEYGETFSLDLILFNPGNSVSGELTVTATTEDPELSILCGSFNVESIEVGGYLSIQEAVNLQLSDAVPDQHEAEISFFFSGAVTWQSNIQLLCNSPELNSGALQIIDDDDGVLDPGETVEIQIPIINIGHATSEEIDAQLTCLTSDVLEITDPEDNIEGLESGEQALVGFTLNVFEDLDPGTAIEFVFQAVSGEYSVTEEYIVSVGNIVENFEAGNFLSYPWIHEGNQNWEITENAFEGDFAAISGAIEDNEISTLKIEFTIPFDEYLSFWKKVSSQADSDIFSLSLDNEQIAAWSGEIDWSQEILEIAAGEHVLEWEYAKDQNGTAGEDKAWLDQIIFPSAGITFPPMLAIIPAELNIELSNIDQYETEIQARNIGGSELNFNAIVPGTLDWLTLSEYSGTLTSGTSIDISVYIDAMGLENGEHTGAIMFNCDVTDFVLMPVFLIINDTGSDDDLPAETELRANYPNPFNPTTTISFQMSGVSSQEDVELTIYNIKGQKIKSFPVTLNGLPGVALAKTGVEGTGNTYTVTWDGRDDHNQPVSSGIYLYKLQAGKQVLTRKMILIK